MPRIELNEQFMHRAKQWTRWAGVWVCCLLSRVMKQFQGAHYSRSICACGLYNKRWDVSTANSARNSRPSAIELGVPATFHVAQIPLHAINALNAPRMRAESWTLINRTNWPSKFVRIRQNSSEFGGKYSTTVEKQQQKPTKWLDRKISRLTTIKMGK